jgi:hypothetical protein
MTQLTNMNDMTVSIKHDVAIVSVFDLKNKTSNRISGHRLNEIQARILETNSVLTTELANEEVLKVVNFRPPHFVSGRSIWNHINYTRLIS